MTPRRIAGMGGSWTLMRGDGQILTDRDLHGRYLLIYFGYTSCPDVCPITLSAVASAMDQLGQRADQVQPVFITVDPAHDTPQVVQGFVKKIWPTHHRLDRDSSADPRSPNGSIG